MNDEEHSMDEAPLIANNNEDQKMVKLANVQAMLGIEDVGQALELLDQNNWDETVRLNFLTQL